MPFPYSATIVLLASGPPNAPCDPSGLWAAIHTALRLDAMSESSAPDPWTIKFSPPLEVRSDFGRYDPISFVSSCVLKIEPVPIGLEVTLHIELVPLIVFATGVAVIVPVIGVASPGNGVVLALAVLCLGYYLVRWRMSQWLRALTQREGASWPPDYHVR